MSSGGGQKRDSSALTPLRAPPKRAGVPREETASTDDVVNTNLSGLQLAEGGGAEEKAGAEEPGSGVERPITIGDSGSDLTDLSDGEVQVEEEREGVITRQRSRGRGGAVRGGNGRFTK